MKSRGSFLPDKQPNIIIVRLEETSADHFGLYNEKHATTPRLQAFQRNNPHEFFVYEKHYANSGATDVALPIMFTGLFSTRPGRDFGHYPLIWDYANSAGYHSFWVLPFRLSWGWLDEKFAFTKETLSLDYWQDASRSQKTIEYDLSISDDDVLELALSHIDEIKNQGPFLGIIGLKLPHKNGSHVEKIGRKRTRCSQSQQDLSNYECGIYDNDFQIARVFEYLTKKKLLKNTIVIGVADHGASQHKRRHRLLNYFEEVMKIPFFMYIPEQYQVSLSERYPEWRESTQASTMTADLVPSLISLLNLENISEIKALLAKLDGRSVFSHLPEQRWVPLLNTNALREWSPEGFGLRWGELKYVFDDGVESLYHLVDDPQELNNIILVKNNVEYSRFLLRAYSFIQENPHLKRIYEEK